MNSRSRLDMSHQGQEAVAGVKSFENLSKN
ncbi:hypothetical protein RSK20926_00270 [Roseobacter sp. SK209-2-6]|nr:hypothetical protein RSK20926_00270 [Roseobacter sp. SK209-2-6]